MTHRPESHLTIAVPLTPSMGPAEPGASRGARPEVGDLALTAAILLVGLLPLALHLAGLGQWTGGALGLGTAFAMFAALQLLDRGCERCRSRDRSRG